MLRPPDPLKTEWLGGLNNGAAGVPNGGSILGTCTEVYGPTPVAAGHVGYSPSHYCALANSSTYDHNMLGEYSFEVAGVDGFFYFFARSDVAHSPNKSNYTFNNPITLPGGSYGSGYDE